MWAIILLDCRLNRRRIHDLLTLSGQLIEVDALLTNELHRFRQPQFIAAAAGQRLRARLELVPERVPFLQLVVEASNARAHIALHRRDLLGHHQLMTVEQRRKVIVVLTSARQSLHAGATVEVGAQQRVLLVQRAKLFAYLCVK